ncbi:hypothetical protein ACFQJ5_01890 [Halomicroarcula sp. GCM10025324]|uniref:hypothetical protein n=1 Tax=Haloarcula TaxID=2237 RepID=UPI0023E8A706|nr:hypothetical protein [Halomicroarcula sp. ZS-22-S1]
MAVAVVLVGVAGVAVFGIGLLGPDRAPTNSSTADGPRAATPTPGPPPFALKIDEIRDCGRTCRDVTSTLRNEQQTSATDIGVTATIYAGRGTGGTAVWDGYEWVGDLDAGGTYTTTQQVSLSLGDALAVERADGWITIQTTVEYDNRVVTFTRERRVA